MVKSANDANVVCLSIFVGKHINTFTGKSELHMLEELKKFWLILGTQHVQFLITSYFVIMNAD